MSQDQAPPVPSAGIVPTPGDQGVLTEIDSSLRMSSPSNNAQEIAQHTGTLNRLDDYFYTHFIRFATFSWSTSQLTGHVLYELTLTPYSLSEPLTYIMALYNQWAGGFQIRVEIAGTGFNGGKLMFVRFPPNVDPSSYDINAATVFPYIMLDPKSQASGIMEIEDYRQGLFHWNRKFTDEYGRIQNTIGTLRVYVMLPLMSASSTTSSVAIQLSARLSPSFVVSQLVPPSVSPTPTTVNNYLAPFECINSYATYGNMMRLTQILFTNSPTQTFATEACYDIDASSTQIATVTYEGEGMGLKVNMAGTVTGCFYDQVNPQRIGNKANVNFWSQTIRATNDAGTFTPVKYAVAVTHLENPTEPRPEGERVKITAPNGESLMTFTALNALVGIPTFDGLLRAIARKYFETVPEGQNVIYRMVDRTYRTPLAYVRLNKGGFFSTNSTGTQAHFDVFDVDFEYHGLLPPTTRLPPTPGAFYTAAARSYHQYLTDAFRRQVTATPSAPPPYESERDSSQKPL